MQARQEKVFTFLLATFSALLLMLVLSNCGSDQCCQDEQETQQEEFDFYKEYFSFCIDWCETDYDLVVECGATKPIEGFLLPKEQFIINCTSRAWEYGCSNHDCDVNSSYARQRMEPENIVAYCQGYKEVIFDDERMKTGLLTRDSFYLQCR